MKVGLLCEHSDPQRGGAESYLAALAERIRVHGHEVVVCARTGPAARPLASDPGGSARIDAYAEDFLPWLRGEGAEVVLTTAPVPGCDFFQPHNGMLSPSIAAHYDSLPWAARQLRSWNPQRRAHFERLREFEARAVADATVLAVSPRVVHDVRAEYPDAQIIMRRPGVDLARFTPGSDPLGPLLFAGGNYRLKGLSTLLRVMRREPAWRLRVAGGKGRRGRERVAFLGHIDDMPGFYRSGSMLVHPTFYDSAAGVVLEALACGLPVVSSVRDGNSDLAVEAGGIAVQDPRDVDELARAIRATTADPERARDVAELFPADAMLDAVVETLVCACSS